MKQTKIDLLKKRDLLTIKLDTIGAKLNNVESHSIDEYFILKVEFEEAVELLQDMQRLHLRFKPDSDVNGTFGGN